MATDISIIDRPSSPAPSGYVGESVLSCVESQEKLERRVPKAIYLLVVGVPFVISAVQSAEITFSIMFSTALCYIGARILIWATKSLVLQPSRRIRYDKAATTLRTFLNASGSLALGPYSWTLGAPGALGASQAGEIVFTDRSTGYQLLRILPHQVADVTVEREARQITHTRHSGGTTLGAIGNGFAAAQTFGGRSTSVTETLEQFFLEIRYQLQKNGEVSTLIVPGGSDRKVVEELCLAIRRLEA